MQKSAIDLLERAAGWYSYTAWPPMLVIAVCPVLNHGASPEEMQVVISLFGERLYWNGCSVVFSITTLSSNLIVLSHNLPEQVRVMSPHHDSAVKKREVARLMKGVYRIWRTDLAVERPARNCGLVSEFLEQKRWKIHLSTLSAYWHAHPALITPKLKGGLRQHPVLAPGQMASQQKPSGCIRFPAPKIQKR